MTSINRKWLVLLAGLIFFVADRLVKYLFISGKIAPHTSLLHYLANSNLAFSLPLPPGAVFLFYFFVLLVVLIIFGLFLNAWRQLNMMAGLSFWLIFLGALSNLIDRFRYSAVIDFIDLKFWPVFNLADIMITAGVAILIVIYSHARRNQP